MRCRTRRENDSQFNGGKNEELYARSFKMLKEGASLRKIKKKNENIIESRRRYDSDEEKELVPRFSPPTQ